MSNSKKKLNEFSDSSLRRIAKEVVLRRFVLILHISTYILVNLLLLPLIILHTPNITGSFGRLQAG